ncbi:MAG: RIP metalloprotease RseP [Pyrinomonadaceae bacterium]
MNESASQPEKRNLLPLIVLGVIVAVAIGYFVGIVPQGFVLFVLSLVFILGTAVVLHEFGHFIVAKMFKMRVETFSVGFGPRVFGKRWGTTDYRLSLIPLGGYVKLGGDESNAAVEGEGVSDIPDHERFDLRPGWQKFLVMVAGPVMNILTAVAVIWVGALMHGVPAPIVSPVVEGVAPGGSAESAGLRVGDRIVQFNGVDNPTWERIRNDALLSPEKPLPAVVERGGQRVNLSVTPLKRTENNETYGTIDFSPLPILISNVAQDSAADEAGLRANDRLVAIDDKPMWDDGEARSYIAASAGKPMKITIERNGARQDLTASTRKQSDGSERIGIGFGSLTPLKDVGPVEALGFAVHRNLEMLRMTGQAIGQIFAGERSPSESFSGPIGIGRAAATAASEAGWAGVFGMLGFLSLNLGVVNLLPIPVLDGGAIFLLLVEAILGWIGLSLTMRMRERIQQVGFVMLLLLMGFVITNDLVKEASNWRNSGQERPAATAPTK